MKYKSLYFMAVVFAGFMCLWSSQLKAQITAPAASTSFPTDYSDGFINSGGENDMVFVFCAGQGETDVGSLQVNAPGCSVDWYQFDGVSYQPMGIGGQVANDLESGGYMARVNCGGDIECYRAWVWVNTAYVNVDPIEPGCETFTLNGDVDPQDTEYTIQDPPGMNFEVNENTSITVCFWANHTYVSDIGFYLKSPGHETDEPAYPPPNPNTNNQVVELCPAASDWGPSAAQGSWTGMDWSTLDCSDPSDENTVCNSGNNVQEFCFTSELPQGNPTFTPCVCDLPTPLSGTFASVGPWSPIYGAMAGDAGWTVQIYDCEGIDTGSLTRASITFTGETACGETSFTYDSGEIESEIADNSCDAQSASIYIVPPSPPPGQYTVTSSLSVFTWTNSVLAGWSSTEEDPTIETGSGDFPQETSTYTLTATEVIDATGNPTCTHEASQVFETLPADATIDPVMPRCANDPPVQLDAEDDGGLWTASPVADAVEGGTFYPGNAGPGEHVITYTINGPCADEDTIHILIYDNISVENFLDTTCNDVNTEYTVSFDVVGTDGQPADFFVNGTPYSGSYSEQFNSQPPEEYHLTVTDANGCSEILLEGIHDCGCASFAGSMTSLDPLELCEDECADEATHEGNQTLDGNDVFEFIIHDGIYPPNILARNPDPAFCFTDIPGGEFYTTYYISAVAGNNDGSGHVSLADPCYSQSQGTPVIWHENPIAHVDETELSTCGMTMDLSGTEVPDGMIGTWTADVEFWCTGGTDIHDNEVSVLAESFGDATFTWNIQNGGCVGSDDVLVHFNETPSAYAGEDTIVCGVVDTLNAQYSITGTTGQWSGAGASFTSPTDPNSEVTVNGFGTYVFTWTETNGGCFDTDNVTVEFLQSPQPNVTNNIDTVCGVSYELDVNNVIGDGVWHAYIDGSAIYPNFFPSPTDPEATVTISNYDPLLFQTVEFEWVEEIQHGGNTCTGSTSIQVTFAREPSASVGVDEIDEVCGNTYTFDADTTGSGWADGQWVAKEISAEWLNDDNTIPDATVIIDSLGSYGDSAYVATSFLWIMSNSGSCVSIDTMYVTFYKEPEANAGLDDSICGYQYPLGAVYSIPDPDTSNYDAMGQWFNLPDNPGAMASVSFVDEMADSTSVNVAEAGLYGFEWVEYNSNNASSCKDRDTVWIEFKEIPLVDAGDDFDVCGDTTSLNAVSSQFPGSWLNVAGVVFDDYTDPHASVDYNNYGDVTFIWQESNEECVEEDTVIVHFWREPSAEHLVAEDDTICCGRVWDKLRAENPGSGVDGLWTDVGSPNTEFWYEGDEDPTIYNPDSTWVPYYGYHTFYWIESTGPEDADPGFCVDSSEAVVVRFLKIPEPNAGLDTIFCGYEGSMAAEFTPGIDSTGGEWNNLSPQVISFDSLTDPNSGVVSEVLTTDNPNYDYFQFIWTESNDGHCPRNDTVDVRFARIPTAELKIIPPKCFGEAAFIKAKEDSLQSYQWDWNGGIVDSTYAANTQGGYPRHHVRWLGDDTAHIVGLISENYWGCQSPITQDTVYEPLIPEFEVSVWPDTCELGKGGVSFGSDTIANAFEWLDTTGTGISDPFDTVQYNIPVGSYQVEATYLTFNNEVEYQQFYESVFGTSNCWDTLEIEIDTSGMIDAMFEIDASVNLNELVAPNASVWFVNNTEEDDVLTRCVWYFGDGETENSCDEQLEHIYTEPNECYQPYLVVYARDLPECRDTAQFEECIVVDDESELEVPNIFTPNGDGHNDFFQVKASTLKEFHGIVVNRWGRTLYEWDNWEDEDAGWDGKLSGGNMASPGVYYYIIRGKGVDNKDYELEGAFHLMRNK